MNNEVDPLPLRALVSSVEGGTTFDMRPPEERSSLATRNGTSGRSRDEASRDIDPPDKPPATVISADWIRAILIGLPLSIPDDEQPRGVTVRAAGIRIRSATITGHLNLNDLSGPGGSALAGLEFVGCWFTEPLSLRRCHLKSLSLLACRFDELQAADAVIDGPVNLSRVRRVDKLYLKDIHKNDCESDGCWVVLTGARIGGRLNCDEAHFAATPRDDDPEIQFIPNSKHARYALDLRAAQVRGSVILRPDVKAIGGISFNLAKIEGSIWCNGAHLTAAEEHAFSADYVNIQGSLYMRTYDPPHKNESTRFVAQGSVSIFAAKIGGNLYMEGAELHCCHLQDDHKGAEIYESLDATNATIGGNCNLRWWKPDNKQDPSKDKGEYAYPFEAQGKILLRSASIGNDFTMSGASIESLEANNIEIGGDCWMSVYSGTYVPTSRFPNRPRMSARSVYLEGAVIKGDLNLFGSKLGIESTEQKKEYGLFARSAKIGGNCNLTTYPVEGESNGVVIRFECYGRIQVPEASIGNSLVMEGAKIVWKTQEPNAALDFSGTTIGGHAKFMTWQPEEGGECVPFEVRSGENGLRLAGTRIAQKLILNGSDIQSTKIAIYAPNAEIGAKASLGTYRERSASGHYTGLVYHFNAIGKITFTAANIKLGLDMRGAQLRPPFALSTSDISAIAESIALDLTLAHMKFADLTDSDALSNRETALHETPHFGCVGAVVLEHTEIDTKLDLKNARVQGRLVLDYARIGTCVDLTGARLWSGSARTKYEEMHKKIKNHDLLEDKVIDELMRDHAEKLIKADLSLHSARVGDALIVSDLKIIPEIAAPDGVKSQGSDLTKFNRITVDLRGLHIEELQDEGGDGWGSDVRLWLDGFRYTRLTPLLATTRSATSQGTVSRVITDITTATLRQRRRGDEVWTRRLQWLDLQFFDKEHPHSTEFTPGAYEQLAKTLRADGSDEDARKITSAKLTRESVVSSKWSRKIIWGLFKLCFGYGFSPLKALTTFVLCIAVGSATVWIADSRGVLVANTSPPETMIFKEGGGYSVHSVIGKGETGLGDEPPCGKRISPVLYALDVFVPVLDLRQQSTCSVSPKLTGWRYAQAVYALLGWLLTPLTVLTFSGILKRHLEN